MQALGPAILLQRNSNTGVFVWNSRNFQEYLFWRTSMNDCFYTFIITLIITLTFITFTTIRSSPLQMFYKIGVLKNVANFTGKHLCWSLFLIKLQTWICNFNKRRLQHSHFSVKFAKFLRISFLTEHLWWLLLYHCKLHLYRLRILTIALDCNIIPCLFELNFVFFLRAYIFLKPYSKIFVFYVQ